MDRPLIAVVTGAVSFYYLNLTLNQHTDHNVQSRSIGKAICAALIRSPPSPMALYAASRSGEALGIAVPSNANGIDIDIRPVKLSLMDNASIAALSAAIFRDHGRCNVLINNAGVYYYREQITPAECKKTLDVNYHGTIKMCEVFIPLMPPKERIVNVTTQAGQLKHVHPLLHPRFLAPDLTLKALDELVQENSVGQPLPPLHPPLNRRPPERQQQQQAAARGNAVAFGWQRMAYSASKAALNAATRVLARQNPQLLITCCCPGWVATDLGEQAGPPPKTPEEGALIPLRVGLGDVGGVRADGIGLMSLWAGLGRGRSWSGKYGFVRGEERGLVFKAYDEGFGSYDAVVVILQESHDPYTRDGAMMLTILLVK